MCSGKVIDKPIVLEEEGNKIVIRPMMNVVFTLDHRYGDIGMFSAFLKQIRDYVEDPAKFENNNKNSN